MFMNSFLVISLVIYALILITDISCMVYLVQRNKKMQAQSDARYKSFSDEIQSMMSKIERLQDKK